MRLTTVILIATIMQVSAFSYAQKMTYVNKNVSLQQLFKEITKQTGYNVFWYAGKVSSKSIINANFKQATLENVLDVALTGLPLTYEINGKTVVIKQKEKTVFDRITSLFALIDVTGRVVDENGNPLVGATVIVKGSSKIAKTNEDGYFSLAKVDDKAILIISFLGFDSQEVKAVENIGTIKLAFGSGKLEEVEVISTGYQNIPKERAAGSYTVIDNKTLNRVVSADLLSRLKGVGNGILFDNQTGNNLGLSVRGRSTIFSNASPLIVIDNFPFDGDLNTINPEIVENITVLKDAAAASIWGVRAGNGVIIITTKKGSYNHVPTITLKSDLTIGEKPDLYYQKQINSNDFIDIEKFLFDKGAFTASINNGYSVISPVVAILQKIKVDPAYETIGKIEIEKLRNIDYRDQQKKYLYRNGSQQRYFIDLNGGGSSQTFYFSAGYDKNLPSLKTQSDSRVSLKGSNSYRILNGKLALLTDIAFSKSKSNNIQIGSNLGYLPYEQLAGDNGEALEVLVNGGLRSSYTDTAGKGKLLDWKLRPLNELKNKNSTSNRDLTDYRLNFGLTYKILSPLVLSLNYQYYSANSKIENLNSIGSFSTRDAINRVTQINSITGAVTRPIPLGGIYNPYFQSTESNVGRAQLNFAQSFSEMHEFSAIGGLEIRSNNFKSNSFYLYGYDSETATSVQIDPVNQYKSYITGGLSQIGQPPRQNGTTDRYVSWYGNGSYTYNKRYIAYLSYRKDKSNIFGVKANQKGIPLWSAALAWNINREKFYNIEWLPYLQLKGSFGYNGNVNNSLSAYLTAKPSNTNTFTNSTYYEIVNPPNDNLRWEKVKNINFGLNFTTKGDRISGSLEYYIKNGTDLIGTSPIAPQTGISIFTGNTADTHAQGFDIQLNSKNLLGVFKWATTYIFNYNKDKITNYKIGVGMNSNTVTQITLVPIVGYPINSLFSYKWGGLDASGNPQGYFDGSLSNDYTKISNSNDPTQLEFFGSRTPTIYGSLRNTFSFSGLEFSFNITYKTGFYFRRQSLDNSALYNSNFINFLQPDYEKRWQNPGDELTTSVPSLVYPNNFLRSSFYSNSAVLTEKGDYIRLQDVQINYSIPKKIMNKLLVSNLNIYAYVNNLGLIWKANKEGLDPDVRSGYPNPTTFAFGLKTNF
ncbi:SusC/RagA family TonB-linked outer membrane protein [Pedobacter sp. MC2016-14]|uniref:SusC/RagA family TonB-linked outer membrane protein n=1 Tax=Pedobacter sp. MC2016-14 TaxID=2897327 RepID=UPI001E47A009|nr:SusC/RagA family TonB-linked outer membrane protein [Pedobacter sp. MC2016-14]MCD0489692.1 SusC/RagA family TonB-linked outer membrane protein [Pedobacter sp. MC2016-14]